MMKTNERMEAGRAWLRLVRGEGDVESKRSYLREKGFTDGELEELLKWDGREVEIPLFG